MVIGSMQQFSSTPSLLDIFFTKKHEWVNVEGNKGTIGVSAYAAESLGDIVYAQLPDVGADVNAGEECGALESVKAVGDFFSPVSGTVTEKNEAVENGPAIINQSPMADGWMFKLDLSKPDEVKDLMTEAQYETYLKECEEH